MTKSQTYKWVGSLLLTILLVIFTIDFFLLWKQHQVPNISRVRQETVQYKQEFLALAKEMSEHPLLKSRAPGTRNAGPVLNKKVRWLNTDKAKWPSPPDIHSLAAAIIESYGSGNNLQSSLSPAQKNAILSSDLSWLRQLETYDYWDLEKDSPIQIDLCTATDLMKCFSQPVVDSLYLRDVARVRLAQGELLNQTQTAQAELKQLAYLMASSESFPITLTALKIWSDSGLQGDLSRLSGFTQAMNSYLSLAADPEAQREILELVPTYLNICPWLAEPISTARSLSPILLDRGPGELDFTGNYENYNSLVSSATTGCRLGLSKTIWKLELNPSDLTRKQGEPRQEWERVPGLFHPAVVFPLYIRTELIGQLDRLITSFEMNRTFFRQ